jgi:hypothetical protein
MAIDSLRPCYRPRDSDVYGYQFINLAARFDAPDVRLCVQYSRPPVLSSSILAPDPLLCVQYSRPPVLTSSILALTSSCARHRRPPRRPHVPVLRLDPPSSRRLPTPPPPPPPPPSRPGSLRRRRRRRRRRGGVGGKGGGCRAGQEVRVLVPPPGPGALRGGWVQRAVWVRVEVVQLRYGMCGGMCEVVFQFSSHRQVPSALCVCGGVAPFPSLSI